MDKTHRIHTQGTILPLPFLFLLFSKVYASRTTNYYQYVNLQIHKVFFTKLTINSNAFIIVLLLSPPTAFNATLNTRTKEKQSAAYLVLFLFLLLFALFFLHISNSEFYFQ